MIDEYQPLLKEVKNSLIPIGFELTEDRQFNATFINEGGWSISFEGERYVKPAFDLSIGVHGLSFSVRLLMQIFKIEDKPSLARQLEFIRDEYNNLFVFPPPYMAEYEKMNKLKI